MKDLHNNDVPLNEEHIEALLVEMESDGLMEREWDDDENDDVWTLTVKGQNYANLMVYFLDNINIVDEDDEEENL